MPEPNSTILAKHITQAAISLQLESADASDYIIALIICLGAAISALPDHDPLDKLSIVSAVTTRIRNIVADDIARSISS